MSSVEIESLVLVSSRWNGKNGRLIDWERVCGVIQDYINPNYPAELKEKIQQVT